MATQSKIRTAVRIKRIKPSAQKFKCLNPLSTIYFLFILGYISYGIASNYYAKFAVFKTSKIVQLSQIITLICILNSIFCVTAFICGIIGMREQRFVLIFVAAHSSINVVGSTIGHAYTKFAVDSFPRINDLVNILKHNKLEDLNCLMYFQTNENCCGLWGFWDYPAFLSPRMNQSTQIIEISKYIDNTCYNFSKKLDKSYIKIDESSIISEGMNITEMIGFYKCNITESYKDAQQSIESELLKIYNNITRRFTIKKYAIDNIEICGCLNLLYDFNYSYLGLCHNYFLILNHIIVAWIGILFNYWITREHDRILDDKDDFQAFQAEELTKIYPGPCDIEIDGMHPKRHDNWALAMRHYCGISLYPTSEDHSALLNNEISRKRMQKKHKHHRLSISAAELALRNALRENSRKMLENHQNISNDPIGPGVKQLLHTS